MDDSFVHTAPDALKHFGVTESDGLSDVQAQIAKERYGRNGTFLPTFGLTSGRHVLK